MHDPFQKVWFCLMINGRRIQLAVKKVRLGKSNLIVSKFIFGTAKLHNIHSKRERNRILNLAVEAGFTHFDTSPLYGFGIAEEEIGVLLKLYPELSLTSKYGLFVPGRKNKFKFEVYAQKSLGKLLPAVSAVRTNFQVDFARTSLQSSLARLKRDYIDIFLLHEPPKNLENLDETLQFLLDVKSQGLIRSFGVTGKCNVIEYFRDNAPEILEVIQMEAQHDLPLDLGQSDIFGGIITYGYGNLGASNNLGYIDSIQKGLMQNPNGAIIVSTNKSNRVSQYQDISRDAK